MLYWNTSRVLNNLYRVILNYVNSSIFSTLYSGSFMLRNVYIEWEGIE